MRPLFKWTGGKRWEIKKFKQHYPDDFEIFIEPFVGGGAVFFDLSHSNNVIADVHPEIIEFYKVVGAGQGQEIYQLMSKYPNDEDTYYFIRDKFHATNSVERAFRFYYLRKTCFRGMNRHNKKGGFNVPFGKYKTYNFEELLEDSYKELLSHTNILCCSFEHVFEQFGDEKHFYFLDPPYDSPMSDYGYCKFGREEHDVLFRCFRETRAKCLMVIGETDFIRNLYHDYIVDSYDKTYNFKFYHGRVGDEINNKHLIIKNY